MKNITILGSGRVSRALAAKLSIVGYTVTVGTRDPARRAAEWGTPHVRFAPHSEAVRGASLVVNALPGGASLPQLEALRAQLVGAVLIDLANAMERGPDGLPSRPMYPEDSLGERLQRALPETPVVKALNTMAFMVMTDPRSVRTPPTAFLSGDDAAAKGAVARLLLDLGWQPEWIEDLGDITTARATEALPLLGLAVLRKRGVVPFAISLAL
jgi:predicted dinucleotide-binding enzyme